jgi:hypothetical protein
MAQKWLTFDRQVAEVQVRIAVLNGYTAHGIPSRKPRPKTVWGKGKAVHQPVCATEAIRLAELYS